MAGTVNFDSGWANISGDLTGASAYLQGRVVGTATRNGANVTLAGNIEMRMQSQYSVYVIDPINASATSSIGAVIGSGQIKGNTGTTNLAGQSWSRAFNTTILSGATSGTVTATYTGSAALPSSQTRTASWASLDPSANYVGLTTPRTPLVPNKLLMRIDEDYDQVGAPSAIVRPMRGLCLNAVYSIRGYVDLWGPITAAGIMGIGPLQNNVPAGNRQSLILNQSLGTSLVGTVSTQNFPIAVPLANGGQLGPYQFNGHFTTVQGPADTGGSAGARMTSVAFTNSPMNRMEHGGTSRLANYEELINVFVQNATIRKIYLEIRRVA